jgi:hypothetical protein
MLGGGMTSSGVHVAYNLYKKVNACKSTGSGAAGDSTVCMFLDFVSPVHLLMHFLHKNNAITRFPV